MGCDFQVLHIELYFTINTDVSGKKRLIKSCTEWLRE